MGMAYGDLPDLPTLLAREPADAPPAISAWMARQLAARLTTAVYCMDQSTRVAEIEAVAADLEELANKADPTRVTVDPPICTDPTDSAGERQELYKACNKDMRWLLVVYSHLAETTLIAKPLDIPTAELLIAYGLLNTDGTDLTITPLGRQIAEGLLRHDPVLKARLREFAGRIPA